MPFDRPTLPEILDRIEADMESRLTGDSALLRTALLRVLARVFAGAVHLQYGYVEFISQQLFVVTATREYLNRHGLMWGVNRKAATFAEHEYTFTGTNGTNIPADTRVQNPDGIEFATLTSVVISGGIGAVDIRAVEAGTSGNLPNGTVLELISPITGVDPTGTITDSTKVAGVAEETDDAYRARILERIQFPPAGGTAADFARWAKEVTGVDDAWTFPETPGPGQVTVIYRGVASISTVEDYIEERMPVTADLIVDTTVDKNIDLYISITPNTAELQSAAYDNIQEVFNNIAAPGENILISQIRNAISAAGITDYVIVAIGGTTTDVNGNLVFTGFEYGVLNNITWYTL